jgi:hypothetical protein
MAKKSARITLVLLALLAAPAAGYAQNPPIIPQVVPQVVPQFNNPGPQIQIPRTGNPVEQLSPIQSVNPQPGFVGSSSVIPLRPIKSRHPHKSPHRHWYSICSNDDCSTERPRARSTKRYARH